MADQERKEESEKDDGMTLEECVSAIRNMQSMLEKMNPSKMKDEEGSKELSKEESMKGDAKDEESEYKKFVNKVEVEDNDDDMEEEELSQDEKGDTEKKDGDMDKPMDKKGKDGKTMDSKSFFRELNQKTQLAEKLSKHIGTFDHAEKTHNEIAKYGIKKLGLKCKNGHEISMLEGYLAAAKTNSISSISQDSKIKSGCIDSYLKGVK